MLYNQGAIGGGGGGLEKGYLLWHVHTKTLKGLAQTMILLHNTCFVKQCLQTTIDGDG